MPDPAAPDAQVPPLQWFLAERDAPCPRCGYSLRGLKGSQCPECGEALELSVVPHRGLGGWFNLALFGAGAAFGFHTITIALLALSVLFGGWVSVGSWISLGGLTLLCGVVLVIVWRLRRWFVKRSRRTQCVIAVAMCVWPVASIAALWSAARLF